MKTTIKYMDYEKVMALPRPEHRKPTKPSFIWQSIVRAICNLGMGGCKLEYTVEGLDAVKDKPCLILMNHSCFADMCIAYKILYPRRFNIVCTNDGFIGFWGLMGWAMRKFGCFPTQKFVTDLQLVQDMEYCFKKLNSSVLMYPEASYSFDGTATALPRKMGVLLKKFDVPVIMIETRELFLRNPLYNELQQRKAANAKARAYLLYSQEDVRSKSVKELSDGIDAAFDFDHFKWQKEHGLEIHDDFRADGLQRILYKCTSCGVEGKMEGSGTMLTCHSCGKQHELTPMGELKAVEGETKISHIPDYYRWEREQVRQEILEQRYKTDCDVDIVMIVDYKTFYAVGEGHLVHDHTGFTLTGCDGRLHYHQPPQASYGLFADFYWYETGDIVSIGDMEVHYFCMPKGGEPVAKMRLAAEEMYKLYKARKLPTA